MMRSIASLLILLGVVVFHTSAQLPGTAALTWEGDLSVKMMDGAHQFVERKIRESLASRQTHWQRDDSSGEAYENRYNRTGRDSERRSAW